RQRVEGDSPTDLGVQNPVDMGEVDVFGKSVLDRRGGVHDAAQGWLVCSDRREDSRERGMVGDIALIDAHLGTRPAELPNTRVSTGCRRPSAADKSNRAGTVCYQPPGTFVAESLDAAGDQIGAVAAQRDFRRRAQPHTIIGARHEDELADMARRLHETESVVEFREGEDAMREWPDLPLKECGRDLGQQLARKIRPANRQLIDVDREIRDVLPEWPQVNSSVEIKIALSQLQKP